LYQFPNQPYPAGYQTEFSEAQVREKRALFINASKLGGLLLIYSALQYVLVRVYYIAAASYHSGSLILLPWDAISYLRGQPDFVRSTTFSMLGNLLTVLLSVTILLIIAKFVMKVHFGEMLRPKAEHLPQALKWMPMCLVINIVIAIVISYIEAYLSAFGIAMPDSDFTIVKPSALALTLQFLYVIVIGPLAEELIYRGLILTLLRPFGKWLAVFFSALIFGIMHGNIPQAASAFGSAIVMALIAVSCGSIVPTIIIHILNNAIASYSDFSDVMKWGYADEIQMGIQIVIFFIGVFIILAYGWQLPPKNDNNYALSSKERFKGVFCNILMAAYFVYSLYNIIAAFIRIN